MYISHIHIENFRGIEKIDLDLIPGVNILIGDNGTGKTTILEAMTNSLGGYLQGIQNLTVRGFQQDDFRQTIEKLGGASNSIRYHSPLIGFDLNIDGKSFHGERSRNDRSASGRTQTRCTEMQKNAKEAANNAMSILPLLCYMSISRVTMAKRSDYGKAAKNQLNDRRSGYIGCMESIIDKTSILEWIKKMSYESILHSKTMPEYTLFQNIVANVMKEINELTEKPEIVYSADFMDIAYIENDTIQPIGILSAGYQSLLWMVMDLAFRLALLNPEMTDTRKATGIIIIDEIDMHLHPKWQWNVVNAFRKTFPGMQLIIATHAPIIIASCKQANLIRLMDLGEVRYLDGAYAYSINNVLEYRQNSSGILKELREKISVFDRLLNVGKVEEAQAVLKEMENEFGYYNAEVVEARTEYELETL